MKKNFSFMMLCLSLSLSASEVSSFVNSSSWFSYAAWLKGLTYVGYTDVSTVNNNFQVYTDRLTRFVNIANSGAYDAVTKNKKLESIALSMRTSFNRQFEYIPNYFISDFTTHFEVIQKNLRSKNFSLAAKSAFFALNEIKKVQREFNQ